MTASEQVPGLRSLAPRWLGEFDRLLAVCPQFVISGNIRDIYLMSAADGAVFLPIVPCLWEALAPRGFSFLLVYDPVEGIRVYPEANRAAANNLPGVQLRESGATQVSLEKVADWMRSVATARDTPCALVVNYASRLVGRPQDLTQVEREFFAACQKIAHTTQALRPLGQGGPPPFNPIVWLIDRPNDLPDWFVVGNDSLRTIVAALPDRETRADAAFKLAKNLPRFAELPNASIDTLLGEFADLTDGLTLRSMMAISALARDQGLPLTQIADAIRRYKVGMADNPWKKGYLKEKLLNAEEVIEERVKGQHVAVSRALDILIRSVMGLSGAQTSARGGRPRGVLFFAGPTGVGKTELAKAMTKLIFGDEQAYKRFDMSEFSAEHSDARLIGAPPGYVGYDAGGELINAVRERPFSFLLFDEVEKAHPRILDKFLQILEDGRLTDGRGETVFFSESVIIFTSNLGVYVEEDDMSKRRNRRAPKERVLNVPLDTPYPEIEKRIRTAIENHFRFKLQRPELLNRIGDNIVVFDFIQPLAARQILENMLRNVRVRVREEHSIELSISETAYEALIQYCTEDLTFGGRGIGNRLETIFINPLARALFHMQLTNRRTYMVQRIFTEKGIYSLELA